MNSLDRFISVQNYVYEEALTEIKQGEKKSPFHMARPQQL